MNIVGHAVAGAVAPLGRPRRIAGYGVEDSPRKEDHRAPLDYADEDRQPMRSSGYSRSLGMHNVNRLR